MKIDLTSVSLGKPHDPTLLQKKRAQTECIHRNNRKSSCKVPFYISSFTVGSHSEQLHESFTTNSHKVNQRLRICAGNSCAYHAPLIAVSNSRLPF